MSISNNVASPSRLFTSATARLSSVALSAMLTLAMLAAVDSLADPGSAASTLATHTLSTSRA